MGVGRRPAQHHRMVFNAIRFFILLTSMWKRERELWMRPRTLEGWRDEVLPEIVQHQKTLQYLSANVRPFWRWNDWGRSRREEKERTRKCRRLKASATTSFRLLTALCLLLIMAGDVELNPGPLGDGTHLGSDDLLEVLEEVWGVSSKWFNIGLQLKLPADDLKNIKQQNPDQHDALREMLSLWLDGVGSVPTWTALADALESRIVGAKILAAELRTTYHSSPQVPDTPSYRSDGATVFPTPISGASTQGTTLEETNSPGKTESHGTSSEPNSEPSGTGSEPNSEPSGTGSEPSSESSGTSSEPHGTSSEPRGTSSDSDISGSVKSGDKDPSHDSAHSQPTARMSGLPFLDADNLKDWEKDTLKGRLLEESEDMMFAFQKLVTNTSRSLTQREVTPDDLMECLNALGGLEPTLKDKNTPFCNHLVEMETAGSIRRCFFIIRDYLSFFNYHTIEHIIEELGTDKDRTELKAYKEKLAEYSRRRVFECPPKVFGLPSKSDHDFAVVKLDKKLEQYTLEQIQRFQSKLSNIIGIPQYALQLISVEKGCMILTFQIPSVVKELVFPLSADQKKVLQTEGVLWLKCGAYQFPCQNHGREDEDGDSDSDDANTSQAVQELSIYSACGYKRIPIHPDSTAIKNWSNNFKSVTSQVAKDSREAVSLIELKEFLLRQSHILYPESKYIEPFLLAHADSVSDFLDALTPQYINFLNWSLLLQIANTINPQSRHTIEEYTSQFLPSTRLKTLPDPLSEDEIVELHGVKRLTVTCDGGGSDRTLGDVWRVQTALEKATGINRAFLPFAYWESSYSVHDFAFLIPESAVGILEELCDEDLKILAICDVRSIDIDYYQVVTISKEVRPPIQVQDGSRVRTKDFGLEHLIPEDTVRQMNREELSHLTDLITSTPQGKLQQGCSDKDLCELAKNMESWKDLAPYFGVNDWRVEEIEENYPNKDDQKYLALLCWKRINPSTATYEDLVECLLRHGHVRDVEYLLDSLKLDLPPFVQRAQDKLRKRYTEAHFMGNLWPGAPNLMELNRSLAPIPVEHLNASQYEFFDGAMKETISIKGLLTQLSGANISTTFIVMGPRCSGKTVLMKQLCAFWAKQYALREFPLVLYINWKSSDPRGSLRHIVQSQFPGVVADDIWKWIECRKGKDVLFICDGYEADSVVSLEMSTNITTCTQFHKDLQLQNKLCIKLLGLSDTQIAKQTVVSLGPDQAGDFLLYLSENPNIKSLVSTPVYLAAVIYMFIHVQPDQLPRTWTQMFACLTYLLALNACKKELKVPVSFTPLMLVQYCKETKAAETGNQADVTYIIQQMCKLATENDSRVFQLHQQEQFQSAFLHRSSESTPFFTFIVPLLQDFLAALQIHMDSMDKKLLSMNYPRYDEFPHTWQFYAGLSKITTTEFLDQSLLEDYIEDKIGIVKCLLESAGGDVMKLESTLLYSLTPDLMEEAYAVDCIAQSCGCLQYTQYESYDGLLEPVSAWELFKCLASPCCLLNNTRCAITVLNLSENKISDVGALVLGEILKVNHSLVKLDLRKNEISDDGASVFGEMLKVNESLKKLDLSGNKISDDGASVLGEMLKVNQSLVKLDLSWNEISDDGSSAFGEMLKVNESLKELDLSRNKISDVGASVLGEMLKANQSLVNLDISWNEISDDGASVFVEVLKVNESLKELDLSGNEISDVGASVLGEMLKANRSLVKLDLSGNEISDDGASVFSEMLKVNESLKELDLSWNRISDVGASVLGEMLKPNQSLVKLGLSGNPISTNGALVLGVSLMGKQSLVKLDLDQDGNLALLKLKQSPEILNLSGNEISDDGASVLGEMLKVNQSLKELNLSWNKISYNGASALGEMLKVNNSLKELNLFENKISDNGASVLGEMLKFNHSLVKLHLGRNKISDDGASVLGEMLRVNQSLQELNLSWNPISTNGALVLGVSLMGNQSLVTLNLNQEENLILQRVKQSPEILNFSAKEVSDVGASALCEMLKVNQSLVKLDLSENRISDDGSSALGEMLKVNHSLKDLNLSRNKISDCGASLFGEMLKVNQSLRKLDLSGNEISDDGASVFGEMLKVNESLKELNLSENWISDHGATVLGDMLKVNQSLKELNLIGNSISDVGVSVLGEMLKVNWTLKVLRLGGQRVTVKGISSFIESVKVNKSLKCLDFCGFWSERAHMESRSAKCYHPRTFLNVTEETKLLKRMTSTAKSKGIQLLLFEK